jgi:hypothetical protein
VDGHKQTQPACKVGIAYRNPVIPESIMGNAHLIQISFNDATD